MEENREKTTSLQKDGPQIERSEKETRRFGKRIIIVFLASVGVVIFLITMQARFKLGDFNDGVPSKSYRTPSSAGFAELAASMRRDRQNAAKPERPSRDVKTQRIVIQGKLEENKPVSRAVPALPPVPGYYSNNDDAQIAQTLRNMKIQAITAKPVVENFDAGREEDEGGGMSSGTSGSENGGQFSVMASSDPALTAVLMRRQGGSQEPNGQAGKQDFLRGSNGGGSMTPQGYSASLPVPQQFPYELKAGTVIPGVLLTGINSDLPGNVIAQVSENVWDTATGKYVLIPKGTRILGVYDSRVTFGQRRVQLVWNRLIFPNGTTLDIAGSPGIDQAGYSGLSGRVNEHWGTMLKSEILTSVFVAGAEIVYDSDSIGSGENKSPRDVAAESAAGSILDMGTKLMNKASDIQPTITIRRGKKMAIYVQRDVVFPFPYF
jgi:type IV secretory pathway VirB10-like protein